MTALKLCLLLLGAYGFAVHMNMSSSSSRACPADAHAEPWPKTVHFATRNESTYDDPAFVAWYKRATPRDYDRIIWTDEAFSSLAAKFHPELEYDRVEEWEDRMWMGQRMAIQTFGGIFLLRDGTSVPPNVDASRLRFVHEWYLSGRANDSVWHTNGNQFPLCAIQRYS